MLSQRHPLPRRLSTRESSDSDEEDWTPQRDAAALDGSRQNRRNSSSGTTSKIKTVEHTTTTSDDFPPVQTLIAGYDWANSPLGDRSSWPEEIVQGFNIVFASEFPAALYVNRKELLVFWNDKFAETVMHANHPALWGKPAREAFPDLTWLPGVIGEVIDSRKSFMAEAFQVYMRDGKGLGFTQESYYDFTMGPLVAKDGSCNAIFNMCTDVSQLNLLQRRIQVLSNLATCGARAQSVEGAAHSIVAAASSTDVPWLAIYTVDSPQDKKSDHDVTDELSGVGQARSLGRHKSRRTTFRLTATSFDEGLANDMEEDDDEPGTTTGSTTREYRFVEGQSRRDFPAWLPPLPATVRLTPTLHRQESNATEGDITPSISSSSFATDSTDPSPPTEEQSSWPFHDLSADQPHLLLSTPSATSPLSESLILAITTQSPNTGRRKVIGILVAGINEHRPMDEEYLKFLQGVGQQLETGLLNGTAREEDRRAAEALKRLNYERVSFFQNTAHELRTPLTLMLGPLEELVRTHSYSHTARPSASPALRGGQSPTESMASRRSSTNSSSTVPSVSHTLSRLSLITRNARRLLKLVNSILRFSSIEAGSLETHFTRQRTFGCITRHLVECFEPLSSQTGVELRMEPGLSIVKPATRDGQDAVTAFDQSTEESLKEDVYIDTELWEQVVFNLISNAFKHTWKGSVTCALYETIEDGKEGFRFDVTDTGVGISEMHVASVFERFYRADNSASRSTEGTGIGLSLVKELVRLHGGRVGVESELGVGSTFYLWIPRGLDHLPHERISGLADPGDKEAQEYERMVGKSTPLQNDLPRAAMERWNKRANGVERAEILDQMESWANAREWAPSDDSDLPMDDRAPSAASSVAPEDVAFDEPTPLAPPPNLVEDSYFPFVAPDRPPLNSLPSEDRMSMDGPSPGSVPISPSRTIGTKRKIGESTSARPPSARRDPSFQGPSPNVDSSTSPATWYNRPRLSTPSSSLSSLRSDRGVDEATGRAFGLPSIDASDRPTVLVVDDNADMREWVTSILRIDYHVIEAQNGREAMERLETLTPDLVLSDVMMPFVDGMTLVREIRKHPRLAQIPTILLSARSGLEDSVEGLDSGASDYLTKPFNVNDLLARCRVHIRLNRLRIQTAEYESELIQQQAQVEAKNQLLSLVGHELRTPLSSIVGAVELLQKESMEQAPHKELLETISSGADALGVRIEQLLDVASADAGKPDFVTALFSLDDLIAEVLARHSPVAASKGLQLFSIVGRVPPQAVSDQRRLGSVFDALLSNAVKFSTEGEIIFRVWLENTAGEELEAYDVQDVILCFAISDTGPGVSEELAQRIFQPFQLADSTSTRAQGGTGLGLALALHVVELAGGQIGIDSTEGVGSTFRCRWPIKISDGTPTSAQQDSTPSVALVSSRPTLAHSIACTASMYGWDYLGHSMDFDSAAEAWTKYAGDDPLIIFVDEALLLADTAAAKTFLARTSPSTGMSPAAARPTMPSYAIVLNSTSASGNLPRDFRFHGSIAAPCHRTAVLAAVTDVLIKRRRPSVEPVSIESVAARVPPPAPTDATPFPRGRLLIAEDNKINAKLLVRQLKTLGFAADEAEHGLRVLDLIHAQNTPPTLSPEPYLGILMDLDMPVMDGFESTSRVRALGGRFQELPILAVTANASSGHRDRCLGAGFNDFVSKPISISQLTALLKRNGLYAN